MSTRTEIEWTDATWNPVTGCTKVSPGCKHCYAERIAMRLQAMGSRPTADGVRPDAARPTGSTSRCAGSKPRRVFVNSMSDLFHEDVPATFIRRVFDVMRRAHWHTFQVLTKRPSGSRSCAPRLAWPANVWMGVSRRERATTCIRIDHLRQVPAAVRFLSLEPLLGPIPGLDLTASTG